MVNIQTRQINSKFHFQHGGLEQIPISVLQIATFAQTMNACLHKYALVSTIKCPLSSVAQWINHLPTGDPSTNIV